MKKFFEFKCFCGIGTQKLIKDGKLTYRKRVVEYGYLYVLFNVTCVIRGDVFERDKKYSFKLPASTKKEAIELFKKHYYGPTNRN